MLYKARLINPHLTKLDRRLQRGVIEYTCIPLSWDLVRQRMMPKGNLHKGHAPRGRGGGKDDGAHEMVPPKPQIAPWVVAS